MNESWYNPLAMIRAMMGNPKPNVLTSHKSEFGQKTRGRIQQLQNRARYKQRPSRSR